MDGKHVEAELLAPYRIELLVEEDRFELQTGGGDRAEILPGRSVKNQYPAGTQNPVELTEGARPIGHRVQHMGAEHHVDRGCRELEFLHVHSAVGERMVEIDREPGAGAGAIPSDHTALGPDVKHVRVGDQVETSVEEEAQLAVPLVSPTAGAVERRIREKAPETPLAARASDAIAPEHDRDEGEDRCRRSMAQRAWNEFLDGKPAAME